MEAVPGRQTVFQLLNETLTLAKRVILVSLYKYQPIDIKSFILQKTFIHRFIYAGHHKNDVNTEEFFTKIINGINENYVDEPITGLLLLYSNHFMHIIDVGS